VPLQQDKSARKQKETVNSPPLLTVKRAVFLCVDAVHSPYKAFHFKQGKTSSRNSFTIAKFGLKKGKYVSKSVK